MINKVTLIGHLGGDPEIRHLENGTAVGRFSLATNENYKDKEGNWQTQTEWHNIVVWRELAERAEKQLKKGMQVYVDGKISYRKFAGQDGQERYVTDIVANQFRLLEKREGGSGMGSDMRFPTSEPTARVAGVPSTPNVEVATPAEGDDLPF
ncbi:MAG: single-stranded DNA-binding protein [Haliscomenobacteraceae bacterium CHB4]|nr:Single-stranded DNA-binding protein [Saprospiraceae bacterium]MCE7922386.1 single-stranded DNA-binding protein [Haliscomenobacteraceae bacterium CHB4]